MLLSFRILKRCEEKKTKNILPHTHTHISLYHNYTHTYTNSLSPHVSIVEKEEEDKSHLQQGETGAVIFFFHTIH